MYFFKFIYLFCLDDLLKAREKLKAAECESELVSDDDPDLKKKRKRKKRVLSSSSDESDLEINKTSFTIHKNLLPISPEQSVCRDNKVGLSQKKKNITPFLTESSEGNYQFSFLMKFYE